MVSPPKPESNYGDQLVRLVWEKLLGRVGDCRCWRSRIWQYMDSINRDWIESPDSSLIQAGSEVGVTPRHGQALVPCKILDSA